jgi:DNA-binding winged helix-turn-helix (wHTH) protein
LSAQAASSWLPAEAIVQSSRPNEGGNDQMNVYCAEGQSATNRTGSVVLDRDSRTASVEGQTVRLTPKEYEILELLSVRKGTALTKEMLLDHLYGGKDEPEQKIIDVFVCKLRKKLVQATGGGHYIETLWGRGYVLRDPAPAAAMPASAPESRSGRYDTAVPIAAVQRVAAQPTGPVPGGGNGPFCGANSGV